MPPVRARLAGWICGCGGPWAGLSGCSMEWAACSSPVRVRLTGWNGGGSGGPWAGLSGFSYVEEAVDTPPKNIILENTDQLIGHGKQVVQFAVQTRAMPLGNETGMTAQERLKLGAWIDNQTDSE